MLIVTRHPGGLESLENRIVMTEDQIDSGGDVVGGPPRPGFFFGSEACDSFSGERR
jgi:hypothetical protein